METKCEILFCDEVEVVPQIDLYVGAWVYIVPLPNWVPWRMLEYRGEVDTVLWYAVVRRGDHTKTVLETNQYGLPRGVSHVDAIQRTIVLADMVANRFRSDPPTVADDDEITY